MAPEEAHVPIRRILVALDATPPSEAALEGAARLAARMEAELLGLFVEDINLLRLAGLPFARESCFSLALSRRLVAEDMERALRAQAGRARALLEETATRQSLRWSFRVVRGRIAEELHAAAEQADLVTFGWPARPPEHGRAGASAPGSAGAAPRPSLFLPRGATLQPPIGVVFDRSQTSRRALALAARLAGAERQAIEVFLVPCEHAVAQELEDQAASLLRAAGVPAARIHRLESMTTVSLLHALDAARLGTFILPVDLDGLTRDTLDELLGEADGAVLLVR